MIQWLGLAVLALGAWLCWIWQRRESPSRVDALKDLLGDSKLRVRYVWKLSDGREVMKGKHKPTRWEIHQSRVRARLKR